MSRLLDPHSSCCEFRLHLFRFAIQVHLHLTASYSKHSSDSPCLLHLYSNPHLSLHLCLFPRESLRTYISVCCCSAAQSCLTLYDPMDCSTPGFPVPHHLLELAQAHVHWVSDAIQPSHPLLSPSPPAFNLSQHQGLFK